MQIPGVGAGFLLAHINADWDGSALEVSGTRRLVLKGFTEAIIDCTLIYFNVPQTTSNPVRWRRSRELFSLFKAEEAPVARLNNRVCLEGMHYEWVCERLASITANQISSS